MKKLLVILGPTGTGKTGLGLHLAKKFTGEIVSADSRQLFAGMDIGTGKIELGGEKNQEIQKAKGFWVVDGIKINLYDQIEPDEHFSVAQFQQIALEKINEIISRGKLPILVGGTGLYLQAVTEGLKIPKVAPNQKLREKLEKQSTEVLLASLKEVDQKTFEKIDQNNRRRIIRALEVYQTTGEAFSTLREKYKVDFDLLTIGLSGRREKLYENVDRRVESWFSSGEFQEEVKNLLKKYSTALPSFTSLGYQDVLGLLAGRLTQAEAVQRTQFKHHAYIRRQLTWFRKLGGVNWLDIETLDLREVENLVKNWLENQEEAVTQG